MRVALVSDVHGDLAALEAVIADIERRAPDAVLHGGDLVLMGAQPAQVVDRIRELGWPGVVGNTDEVLWRPEERARQEERAQRIRAWIAIQFEQYAPATAELLGPERIAWLRELPAERRVEDVLVMHAAPGDLWRAPFPDASDEQLRETYGSCDAAVVAYGHLHRPFVRRLEGLVVANSGSAGWSLDGDPRASYLLFEDGEPQVIRVEYDVERAVAELERSGYPDAARLAEMRRHAQFARPS